MTGSQRLAVAWAALYAALFTPAWTADIPGIVEVPGIPSSAGAESSETVSCLAVVYPYSTWQPSVNASSQQPTSSPVPPYIEGSIDFSITNYGSSPIQAPWTLGIYNPAYTQVLQVWNFDFLNATQGQVYGNASAAYETLKPQENNTVYLGILLRASLNNIQPENITVNGQQCTIQLVNNVTEYLPFNRGGAGAATESAEQPVSISNGNIIGTDGNGVTLKAVNYFGFNNGATMFDGLYAGSDSLTMDFGLNLYRIQALGFNAIRVPFSFQNLFKSQPNSFTKNCNAASQDEIRQNLTPPNTNVPSSIQLPIQAFPEGNDPGVCNQNLPNDSVYHRFLYIIQFLARNNFYILIDDHSEDPTIQNDPNLWVQYYVQLMTDITNDGPSRLRVMVDLFNEPDHASYTWATLGPIYLAAMDAINAIPTASNTLFFVEGTGQNGLPGLNWGDGFVTDTSIIQQYGLSDPNQFFQTLLTKPYLNQVGVAPHVYPPSVTFATQGYSGSGLFYRLYNSFGYLNTVGYGGHLFPILIGEVGSKFATQTDIQSMTDIQSWLLAAPNTGTTHNKVANVFYWDWNANSGDTGGIVDNSWVNILWVKVQWMIDTVGLMPWYLQASSTPSPTTIASLPPLSPSPPPPVPSPPPVSFSAKSSPPPPSAQSPPAAARSPPPLANRPPPAATAARPPPPSGNSSNKPPKPPAANFSPPPPAKRPPPPLASPSPPPPASPSPPPPVAASPPPPASPSPPPPASPSPPPPVSPSPSPPVAPSPPPPVSPSPPPPVSPSPPPPASSSPPPPDATPSPSPPPATASPPPPAIASPPPHAGGQMSIEESAYSPPPGASPPSSSGGACQAYSTQSSPWPSGTGVTSSSVNLFIKNTGSTAIVVPYTVVATAPGYINTQYNWNWNVAFTTSGAQSGTVDQADWETLQPNGQNTVNIGSVVDSSSSDINSFKPSAISINGIPCSIVAAQNPGQ